MKNTEQLWNTRRTAAHLGCHPVTLAKRRVTGDSPPYIKIGGSVLYDPADVDAWLQSRKFRSTSEAA